MSVSPSPPGRRWPEGPDEGSRTPHEPHPRARGPSSSRISSSAAPSSGRPIPQRRPLIRPFGPPSPGGEGEVKSAPPDGNPRWDRSGEGRGRGAAELHEPASRAWPGDGGLVEVGDPAVALVHEAVEVPHVHRPELDALGRPELAGEVPEDLARGAGPILAQGSGSKTRPSPAGLVARGPCGRSPPIPAPTRRARLQGMSCGSSS